MNATDVIGWYVNGEPYCPACTPSTREECGAIPVFGDSETDSFSHCADCEELIPEVLTSEGWTDVSERFAAFLTRREGRPEILRQWAENLDLAACAVNDRELVALVREATKEENVMAAHVNVLRRINQDAQEANRG